MKTLLLGLFAAIALGFATQCCSIQPQVTVEHVDVSFCLVYEQGVLQLEECPDAGRSEDSGN